MSVDQVARDGRTRRAVFGDVFPSRKSFRRGHEATDLEDPSAEFISAEDPSGSYRLLREPANLIQGLRSAGLVPADAASRLVDSAGASPTEISSDVEVSQ